MPIPAKTKPNATGHVAQLAQAYRFYRVRHKVLLDQKKSTFVSPWGSNRLSQILFCVAQENYSTTS